MSSRFTRTHLTARGFEGFERFADLPAEQVSSSGGVYVVLRESDSPQTFLPISLAGRNKGRDPSVAPETLASAWVPGEYLLYIGRAAIGPSGRRGISKRLDEFRRHGAGEPVGHWGGRYVWQLADHEKLRVAWKPDQDPAAAEADLLDEFIAHHGRLPFANLRRGDRRSASTL